MAETRERAVVLYDGHCRFCKAQMRNLLRLARPGAIEPISFQEEGVLDRFQGITYEAAMEAMHLVAPDGRIFRGMEAAVRAVVTRPILGAFAWLYYIPGIRHAADAIYRYIAARRYEIAGRELAKEGCDGGTCAVHFGEPR
jgi:predicted DCC family thiol-disulfide oxidoreductase YuxK